MWFELRNSVRLKQLRLDRTEIKSSLKTSSKQTVVSNEGFCQKPRLSDENKKKKRYFGSGWYSNKPFHSHHCNINLIIGVSSFFYLACQLRFLRQSFISFFSLQYWVYKRLYIVVTVTGSIIVALKLRVLEFQPYAPWRHAWRVLWDSGSKTHHTFTRATPWFMYDQHHWFFTVVRQINIKLVRFKETSRNLYLFSDWIVASDI